VKKLIPLVIALLVAAVPASAARSDASALEGKHLLARQIADAGHTHWTNYELTKDVATALGESAGYLGARHDNTDSDGNVVSRDCGLMQINIQARFIGTDLEASLRTTSTDPAVYGPVLANNVQAAVDLYEQPWTRNGQPDIRRWQPWVAYTSGWATFPKFWVWHQVDGVPTGPWVPTGRYVQRAILGQVNRHVLILRDWTPAKALSYARKYAQHFGVDPSVFFITAQGLVSYTPPPAPASPPADGVGPRPAPNNGA
jgi:hypothetical protein